MGWTGLLRTRVSIAALTPQMRSPEDERVLKNVSGESTGKDVRELVCDTTTGLSLLYVFLASERTAAACFRCCEAIAHMTERS